MVVYCAHLLLPPPTPPSFSLFVLCLALHLCGQVRADVLHKGELAVAGAEGQHQEAEVRAHHGPQDEHLHGAAVQGLPM